MLQKTKCQIKCLNCKSWLSSPIQFGDATSFFGSYLAGNKAQCYHYGKMTDCNKDNMLFDERNSEGKVIHEEGKYTFK
jgi:hypothetical protein